MTTRIAWELHVILSPFIGKLYKMEVTAHNQKKEKHEKLLRIQDSANRKAKARDFVQKDQLVTKNEQILELDRVKNSFFTNISHEFRTPLSLIQSLVEQLLEDARLNDRDRGKFSMIHRNATRF